MDIIDKLFSKIHKDQAPASLRARILDIPSQQQAKKTSLFWQSLRIAVPALLVVALLASGAYYKYFRVPNIASAFELKAETSDVAGIFSGSSFLLKSSKNLTTFQVQKIVQFSPEVDFEVESLGNNTFRIKPKGSLQQDKVYSVSIKEGAGDRNYSWAFQVKAPFMAISSIPGNRSTSAPTNTGIEITFNREGFVNPENYFSITPQVEGKFEQHGSLLVFSPKKPLDAGVIYTVTVKKGMPIKGSMDTLEKDYTFQFETQAGSVYGSEYLYFPRDFNQTASRQPAFQVYANSVNKDRSSAAVYKFNSAEKFIDSYNSSRDWNNSWSYYNNKARKQAPDSSTAQKVADFKPIIKTQDYLTFLEVPQNLSNGYYLLDVAYGNDEHAYLWFQMTPLAHYASFSYNKGLVWLYDFGKKQGIIDAAVKTLGGNTVARTDADGLAQFDTPQEFRDNQKNYDNYFFYEKPNILKVEKDSFDPYFVLQNGDRYTSLRPGSKYWEHLSTDRPLYQLSDTANFWGAVKDRDGKPMLGAKVELRLYKDYYWFGWTNYKPTTQPLARVEAEVSGTGTYQGSMPFAGLSPGNYAIVAFVGDEMLSAVNFQALTYSKPSYVLKVTTDKDKYYTGQDITYNIKAEFYDGTPVSNLEIAYNGYWQKQITGTVKTDKNGQAKFTTNLPYYDDQQPAYGYYSYGTYWPKNFSINFRPSKSEEAFIESYSNIQVFGPKVSMRVESKVNSDKSNTFKATVHHIDINKTAANNPYGYYENYEAGPAVNQNVKVSIKKITYTPRQTGEYYDFISKTVQPVYTYDRKESVVEEFSGQTGPSGEFSFNKKYEYDQYSSYQLLFTTADASGLSVRSYSFYSYYDYSFTYGISPYGETRSNNLVPYLTFDDAQSTGNFSAGEQVKMKLSFSNSTGGTAQTKVLYYNYQRDLGKAEVKQTLNHEAVFDDSLKPSANWRAVVLGPNGFEESNTVSAYFKTTDAELKIELKPDKDKYRPGDEVRLGVKLTDKDGRPVSADVNLSVVDEALFAVTYNYHSDILTSLYKYVTVEPVVSITRYDSVPEAGGKGGGGDGGGGARSKFSDTALYRSIRTGSSGEGEVTFKLPDNLTSWRITAQAVNMANLTAGIKTKNIAAGLPLFADATTSSTYLVGDEPNVRVRIYGTDYKEDQPVEVSVVSQELGVSFSQAVKGNTIYVPLPKLNEGRYLLTVKAKQGSLSDELARTINVIPSYFVSPQVHTYQLSDGLSGIAGSEKGMTMLVFTDSGTGRYYQTLQWYAYLGGVRVDQRAAGYFAQKTLRDRFGSKQEPQQPNFSDFLKGNGLSLITYGDADLTASALTAALLPNMVPKTQLVAYFNQSLTDEKADIHRISKALYGLSALNEG